MENIHEGKERNECLRTIYTYENRYKTLFKEQTSNLTKASTVNTTNSKINTQNIHWNSLDQLNQVLKEHEIKLVQN